MALARYWKIAAICSLTPRVRYQTTKETTATATLTAGPAMAIWNSSPGSSLSWPMLATPPKMKRVMLRTGIPFDWAVNEWPSSWASTEAKRRTLASAPTTQ